MCFGKPDGLLRLVVGDHLPKNDLAHTALDDFKPFCAYTGCDTSGSRARLAYLTASLNPRRAIDVSEGEVIRDRKAGLTLLAGAATLTLCRLDVRIDRQRRLVKLKGSNQRGVT